MNSKPVSIVIVENQPIFLSALSAAISSAGMNVVAEVSGSREAVQTASKLSPDMVLYSIGVPSLLDLENMAAIKRQLPATKILAMVTGEFRGQVQTALEYGAHLVLTKFVPRSELLAAVNSLL